MARASYLPTGSCLPRESNSKHRISLFNREISGIAVRVSLKVSSTSCVRKGVRCAVAEGFHETLGVSHSANRPRRVVGRGSRLIGSGSAVPTLVVSNHDLSKLVDTSDEWISSRTGIHNRRILSGDETLSGLAVESSRKALEMAKVKPEDVDLVLMCTSTPDDLFGGAPQVQREVGCIKALAFDITAACSGFVLGLVTATRFIKGGGFENVLVIGADALSRYVDWTDRGSCILFGDGAGAVLLQAAKGDQDGLLGFDLQTDGHGQKHLSLPTIGEGAVKDLGSSNGAALKPPKPSSHSCIQMNGKEVFRFAVNRVPQVIEAAMKEAGIAGSHLDWLLLHQANQRIISAVANRLKIQPDRVISNLADYGNTSAASIPLALDEAVRSGRVQSGHVIATAGFGAGVTWGSAIVRWD
eukprot:PITA_00464